MRSRSEIHMLTIAAARFAEGAANPTLVEALRAAVEVKAGKKARGEDARDHDAAERQKLFNLLPNGSDKQRLKDALLQRAYDLLWDGNCAGCDALTEWLPSDDVTAMLDAWSDDQDNKTPRSKWYGNG